MRAILLSASPIHHSRDGLVDRIGRCHEVKPEARWSRFASCAFSGGQLADRFLILRIQGLLILSACDMVLVSFS